MEHDAYLDMAAVEAKHWWFRGRRKILIATIERLKLPQNARILELGSGTGGNLSFLTRFGAVTAVEMNETARGIAAEKVSSANILAGKLPDDVPLEGQVFDLICMFDVLEHIDQDEATLEVVRRHLAPGGALVITVPAYRALFGPHDVALHHKRRYERAELAQKLRGAGFAVAKLSFANMTLLPLAVLARIMDKYRGGGRVSGTTVPASWINNLFTRILGAEAVLLGHADLPFGLSLLAVVRAEG